MQQVAKGQRWRRGGGPVWIVDRLDGALAHLHEEDEPSRKALIAAVSLSAGDGGWAPAQSVQDLMIEHSVTEVTARRMLATGERKHEAVERAHYLWDPGNYPDSVAASPHFHAVLEQYGHTLNANPDARAFIVAEVLERNAEGEPERPSGVTELLEQQHDRLERDVARIRTQVAEPSGFTSGEPSEQKGVPKVVSDLREARELLDQYGLPFLSQLAQRQVDLSDLLQAASEHLNELYGPQFEAYRCDVCARVIAKQTLNDLLGQDWEREAHAALQVHVVYKGTRTEHYLHPSYVECTARVAAPEFTGEEQAHGPMRHVLVRVTADDPEYRGEFPEQH